MEFALQREATMDANKMIVMAGAGALAATAIATNAVHLVVGAMLIVPGFEPFLKISLFAVTRSAAWKHGVSDSAKAYLVMIAAAGARTLVLRALGVRSLPDPRGTSPTASTLTGMGIVAADAGIVVQGALRFGHDAAIVLLTSAVVFALERTSRQPTAEVGSGEGPRAGSR